MQTWKTARCPVLIHVSGAAVDPSDINHSVIVKATGTLFPFHRNGVQVGLQNRHMGYAAANTCMTNNRKGVGSQQRREFVSCERLSLNSWLLS